MSDLAASPLSPAETAPGLAVVFGGSGFLGAQVVRALAQRGWRIKAAVRHPGLAYELRVLGDVGQIQPVRADVRDADQVAAVTAGADLVINLVGVLHETPSVRFQAVHADGARHVAEAAARAGARRLVQVSAIGADAASPSAYARSKAAGEAAVREAFPGAVIVRPSVVFGPGDDFLNKFAALAVWAPVMPLIGGGETRLQPIHVADAAEAIARAAVREAAEGRVFEIGGPAVMSLKAIMSLVLRETARERPLLPLPGFAARALGLLAGLPAALWLKPMLTRDQVAMLLSDNVVAEGAEGLEALGVAPTGLEAVAPSYLWRYRRGGQFADRPALTAAA